MDKLMGIVSPHGTVLDPFMGSATTGIAALRRGHRFVGVEMSPGYYGIAEERLLAESERVSA